MSKIAVIKTGGKQYKVTEGQALSVEKLNQELGAKVKLETLMVADADAKNIDWGAPSLGERVEAKVLEHGKGDKVSVVKFKNKVRYQKNVGHRQPFTKLEITGIA
jgi:large subunit ribosomal protein L21